MVAASAAKEVTAASGDLEFELLCQAARPRPGLEQIRNSLKAGIDHRRLYDLAALHGVRLCLYQCFSSAAWNDVPPDARHELEEFRRSHQARSLLFASELKRLAVLFVAGGIPFISFKGPALSFALYGDLAQREYNDLDILVSREHVDDAQRLLEDAGYRNRQGDRLFRRMFLSHQRQFRFDCEELATAVDLHWDLTSIGLPFPVTVDELLDSPQRLSLGNTVLSAPDDGELARLLAGHGTKEGWLYLKWLRDFAVLVDGKRDLDWTKIHYAAERQHAGDTVLVACGMAQEVLGIPPPGSLESPLRSSTRVRALVGELSRRLRRGEPASGRAGNLSDILLCQRKIDRILFMALMAIHPTASDHAALRLPEPLWPLYYVARPFRVGANLLAARRRHPRQEP